MSILRKKILELEFCHLLCTNSSPAGPSFGLRLDPHLNDKYKKLWITEAAAVDLHDSIADFTLIFADEAKYFQRLMDLIVLKKYCWKLLPRF